MLFLRKIPIGQHYTTAEQGCQGGKIFYSGKGCPPVLLSYCAT
jgi:hypothetical protein